MNKIKTTRSILIAVIVAAALGLVACGGGDSSSATSGDLPSGKVSTTGDGVNAAEFEAIQCGMNKDQVMTIVGDGPTVTAGDVLWNWNYTTNFTQLAFTTPTGVVKYKATGKPGNPPSVKVVC
jgi:outer membrane protein assembly factor BamE (lipoprotein component of BamABCDE complex)